MEIFDKIEDKEDQAIIRYLVSIVDMQNINSICDYGCGDGRILKKMEKKLPRRIRYTGIDFWSSEHSMYQMPKNEKSINFIDNESPKIEEFMENNQYDLVFSSFALHHFRLPIKELKRIERLVSIEGYFILIDIHRDYTDLEKIAENVRQFHSQMMMGIRGDHHRIPYTKEETCDLFLALDMEITDQKVVDIELTETDIAEYKTSFLERYKKKEDDAIQDDVSKHRHPAFMDVFKSTRELTSTLINRYGATPDTLLMTTAKKKVKSAFDSCVNVKC